MDLNCVLGGINILIGSGISGGRGLILIYNQLRLWTMGAMEKISGWRGKKTHWSASGLSRSKELRDTI